MLFGTYGLHMLVVDRVTKQFGVITAVDDLSFSVDSGQVLGLLGPNGAGKTTTMRLLVGYLAPDAGSITLDGVSVQDDAQTVRQKIGYLPENNPLYPELLVSEMLRSSAQLKAMSPSAIRESLDFVVPSVGLSDVFHKPIRELSKGYRQRVGIALALLHRPDVLILDEPTEGLDPNQRSEIRALLRTIAKDKTVIISTHVMQEVSALCDRIMIINHGQIVADGTERTLLKTKTGAVEIEAEGPDLLKRLKAEKRLRVTSSERVGKRLRATLEPAGKAAVQPVLAELQQKFPFVLWSVTSAGTDLEHLFKSVTEEKSA